MADWRSAKFKWRMKAYRDHLEKEEQDSIEEGKKEQSKPEDVKRILELWQNLKKKDEKKD